MDTIHAYIPLNRRSTAALELCNHMEDMGAHRVTIPVQVGQTNYVITISKSRSRKNRTVANPPVDVSNGTLGTNKQ